MSINPLQKIKPLSFLKMAVGLRTLLTTKVQRVGFSCPHIPFPVDGGGLSNDSLTRKPKSFRYGNLVGNSLLSKRRPVSTISVKESRVSIHTTFETGMATFSS